MTLEFGQLKESQWSLTFEVRKREPKPISGRPQWTKSQWSLTFEVRKRYSGTGVTQGAFFQSQWSLTFEVRKRDQPGHRLAGSQNPGRNGA